MEINIIHVFSARAEHLVPSIIEGIYTNSPTHHFFIIYDDGTGRHCVTKGDKQKIEDLHNQVRRAVDNRLLVSSSLMSILFFLIREKKPVILHSGSKQMKLLISSLFGIKRVWICWGSVPKLLSFANHGFKCLQNPFKRYYIRNFSKIVCLMKPDADEITMSYHKNDVVVLPYTSKFSPNENIFMKLLLDRDKRESCYKVLLGNSGLHVKSYLSALDNIKKFKNDITVTCMVNYGLTRNNDYDLLLNNGHSYFGKKFRCEEKMYSKEEYIKFLDIHDIYICNVKTQTGLGAISNCLRLGFKIFLDGYNYDWIKSLGYIVFHYSEIEDMNLNEFLTPLTYEQKLYNYEQCFTIRQRNIKLTKEFYESF